MKLSLTNDLKELETLAARLEAFGEREQLSPIIVQQLNLALDELVTNVIQYGYDAGASGQIELDVTRDGESVTAVLSDDGRPFDPLQVKEPDVTLPLEEREVGGLGVFLVRQLMDDVGYARENNRNVVRLRKLLNAPPEEIGDE